MNNYYFDDFDLGTQCEELPGYEEWLKEQETEEFWDTLFADLEEEVKAF